ncbi:hypothetical protein H920_14051 [Fukomys damarensis]|uniref:Uncharacterized protein n=1 Tax=Fukomys damarensis TaxID=885580 RepID=A0A091D2Z3_FUKDA|nr:hypothetical protein H920_14051 [Fukomys damarensis]
MDGELRSENPSKPPAVLLRVPVPSLHRCAELFVQDQAATTPRMALRVRMRVQGQAPPLCPSTKWRERRLHATRAISCSSKRIRVHPEPCGHTHPLTAGAPEPHGPRCPQTQLYSLSRRQARRDLSWPAPGERRGESGWSI